MSRMNPDTDFPTKLKYLRFYYDLSQAYIADSLNVNRLSYMAYENGKVQPPIEMLAAIASFFAVSTDSLLGLAPLEVASDTHAFYPRQVQDAPVCLFRYVLQLCRTRRHLTQLQLCGMLGLEPLYLACEGRLVFVVPAEAAEEAAALEAASLPQADIAATMPMAVSSAVSFFSLFIMNEPPFRLRIFCRTFGPQLFIAQTL